MKTKFTSTRVNYQFQSGRADTLFSNTLHTMGLIGMSFDITNLQLALFQGDDSMIRAEKIKQTPKFFDKLKVDSNPIGDFVGFLVSSNNMHLDIPRMTAKTLSRNIPDQKRRAELALATRDLLSMQRTAQDQYENIVIASRKYDISRGEIEIMYSYLQAFTTDKFLKPTLNHL
nr:MAG: RNA-dependent RNA polymerase [Avian associated hepe-like virus 8]